MSDFYILEDPDTLRGRAEWDDDMDYLDDVVEYCNNPHPYKHVNFVRCDYLHVLLTSRKIRPFIFTWHWEMLITQEVLDAFQSAGLTGFEVNDNVKARFKIRKGKVDYCDDNKGVRQKDVLDIEIPKLYELKVTGWGGIGNPKSGYELKDRCPSCNGMNFYNAIYPELYMDGIQWDGSDFFLTWPYMHLRFITKRVKDVIEKNKFSGARILDVAMHLNGRPETNGKRGSFGPGKLRLYFPDALAHERGDEYGIY